MGETILVVEDEPAILELIREVLEAETYAVVCAFDGKDALRLLETRLPDLILSDFRMPNLDGAGLYKAVRSTPGRRRIPFMFMSATPEALVSLGVHTVLKKPFLMGQLVQEVHKALESQKIPSLSPKKIV